MPRDFALAHLTGSPDGAEALSRGGGKRSSRHTHSAAADARDSIAALGERITEQLAAGFAAVAERQTQIEAEVRALRATMATSAVGAQPPAAEAATNQQAVPHEG